MISPNSVQQVKDVARVEEVISDFMDLKRKGPRFLGLCPFHNEKTPSFNVSPQLGIFKCFGCGESGDSISFLQKHEHLSFNEAIRWLAKRYNIEVEEAERSPEQELEQSEREAIQVVQTWAETWSQEQLWETEEGRNIGLAYFRERGFRDDILRTFKLGYVPERGSVFSQAALAHGFNKEVLEKAGWIKLRENGDPWDFFQGRITFPIHSQSGQPIAFGARTLRSDKKLPKYFNSPESALYVKSRSLYGIDLAKKSIVEQSNCFLVEGYTDVISLHQAGIHNVVASSGTSLTQDQIRLVKRYAPQITLLYDGDAAGIKASLRGIDLILAEGLSVKVVRFPAGEDPDSYAKANGSTAIQSYVAEHAQDFLLFKADVLVKEAGEDPARKASAIHEMVESMAAVDDQVLRALYTQRTANLLGIPEQALISELNKVLRRNYRKRMGGNEALPEEVVAPEVAPPQTQPEDVGTVPQERDLLRMLLLYGSEQIEMEYELEDGSTEKEMISVAEYIFEELANDDIQFQDTVMWALYLDYRHNANLGDSPEGAQYAVHAQEDWRTLAIDLLTDRYHLSPNWTARHHIQVTREKDHVRESVIEGLFLLKERRVDRMIKDAQELLKTTKDDEELYGIMNHIINLSKVKLDFAKRTGRVIVG